MKTRFSIKPLLAFAFVCLAAGASAQSPNFGAVPLSVANNSTGTQQSYLAKITATGAQMAATTDTLVDGVCIAGCGAQGNAMIVRGGVASCVFDDAATIGDYVTISSTTAGACHDAGTTAPTGQIVGRVYSATQVSLWLIGGGGGSSVTVAGGNNIVVTQSGSTFTVAYSSCGSHTAATGTNPGSGLAGALNGSNETFTLAHTYFSNGSLTYNSYPQPSSTWSATGTTLTLTFAPQSTDTISFSYCY